MNWGSASEFFAMGGYGLYVWGSYIMTAAVMALEVILVVRRWRTSGPRSGRTDQFGSESDFGSESHVEHGSGK